MDKKPLDGDKKVFQNRTEAGRELADKLAPHIKKGAIVLGLPRGGVPIGYEIAMRYQLPLDTLVARKIAAPVCSHDTAELLRSFADVVVTDCEVEHLGAIGYWYHDFTQVPDEQVIQYLEKANKRFE